MQQRFSQFSTPCVVVDLTAVQESLRQLRHRFPMADIYYAVKANPAPQVLSLLAEQGICFDIASRNELDAIMALGVGGQRISYGNTIKKWQDIAYFHEQGVTLFATDCEQDVRALAKYAPGSRVYVRMLTEHSGSADWPLSRKFGCNGDMAYDLLVLARDLGLVPYGVSFHVGSQQRDIGQWNDAIEHARYLMHELKKVEDIKLQMLDMGGGFPASYMQPTHAMDAYAQEIIRYLHDGFGEELPRIILEPGRSMVADAGVLVAEVVQVTRKSKTSMERWVYLDAGVFNGLIETLGESIKYRIVTDRDGDGSPLGEVILAGPTCDSMDVMYQEYRYRLPMSLQSGDRLYFLSAGAYTTSYASVCFNGFAPIPAYFVSS